LIKTQIIEKHVARGIFVTVLELKRPHV